MTAGDTQATHRCDLVLGGGGIRGLAHIGALESLEDHGYEVERVAGASAGAVLGAFIVAGLRAPQVAERFAELDFRSFALADVLARLSSKRGIGGIVDRLSKDRVDPLEWIREVLDAGGIRTFGDLRADADDEPPERSYRLVVRCLDVVHRRVVRLPWDYPRYGLEPDEQPVAEAVRASMSIPFVYQPVTLGDPGTEAAGLLIDGGLTSGFPVSIFDRPDGAEPRWPTFGIRLLARERPQEGLPNDAATTRMILEALLDASDLLEPLTTCDERRTVRIDVSEVGALEVDIDAGDEVVARGRSEMDAFLDTWDEEAYREECFGERIIRRGAGRYATAAVTRPPADDGPARPS